MIRELIAILLVGVTLQAQTQATQTDLNNKPPAQPIPRVETYQHYNELRRGSSDDVGIVLIVNGSLTSPRSTVTGLIPVSLTLQPEPGLSYSKLKYPKSSPMKFPFRNDTIPAHSGWFPIEMKLHADKDAALGIHYVHGKFRYQEITRDGISAEQEMDVSLPVTVVEQNAHVTKSEHWPFYHMPIAEVIGLVILCIVLLPIIIAIMPFYLICLGSGRCSD